MDSTWLLYLLPLVAGLLNPVQSGMNGALNRAIEAPAVVALVALAFAFATVAGVGLLFGKLALPEAERAASAPWWAWVGGVLGAAVLIAQPIAAPRLGAAPFMGILITASVCAALALDHYGVAGFPEHAASWGRIGGAALMIVGVWLVATL
jgi:bacterial/archaeal transporter family-2 protein